MLSLKRFAIKLKIWLHLFRMLEPNEGCNLDWVYPSTSSSVIPRKSPSAVPHNISGWDELVEFYHTEASESVSFPNLKKIIFHCCPIRQQVFFFLAFRSATVDYSFILLYTAMNIAMCYHFCEARTYSFLRPFSENETLWLKVQLIFFDEKTLIWQETQCRVGVSIENHKKSLDLWNGLEESPASSSLLF